MRSYPLLIDGQEVADGRWSYVMRADAAIADPRGVFAAKRALELGRAEVAEHEAEIAGRCAKGDLELNRQAIAAAAAAKREMARMPLDVRKQIGREIHAELLARRAEFSSVLVDEGHPKRLADWEVDGLISAGDPRTLDWLFSNMRQEFDVDGRTVRIVRKPDGVVCLSPPQNAAAANAGLGMGALLAGNALVVKAPRTAPLGVMFLYHEIVIPVLRRHGAPAGAVNLVSGPSKQILEQWVESPLVDDVMFFGDSSAGMRLEAECVAHGKKAILELSGNDSFVVWRDANLEQAADALTECFYGAGQICMVPKRAFVHPEIADRFLDLLVTRARGIQPGLPSEEHVLLSPVLKVDRFFEMLGEAERAGGEVLCGGRRVDHRGQPSATSTFLEPTVLRLDSLARAAELGCVREETFFPLLPVVVPGDVDEAELLEAALAFVEDNRYGLRNSLWTLDPELTALFTETVGNGGLLKVNDSHVGFTPIAPTHGGTGLTGGAWGELHYPMFRTSHMQGVVVNGRAQTLSEALRQTAQRRGEAPAIRDGSLGKEISWAEYDRLADRVATVLRREGLRSGDTVALLLRNRWEFHVLDAGAMRAGVTTVSLYDAATADQKRHVLGDSGARWLFAERALLPDRGWLPPGVERVTVVDDEDASDVTLAELTEQEIAADEPETEPGPDDLLCLVYTSGTTGEAKGVEIDHRAALRGARGFLEAIPMQADGRVVSYLPMAHVAERACSHYMPMLLGTTVHCCHDPKEVFGVLPRVRPTFFFSVPRLWEKLLETIRERIGTQPDDVQARFERGEEELLSALRAGLGLDQARYLVVGAAATPPAVLRFFDRLGLPLLETWGMTELCAVATANRPGNRRLGSVGQPIGDVELRIAADGEVLARTGAMLRGYRNRPEETRVLVDAEGWLHTGDLGQLDGDGFLTITGRKKELIVSAQGKNVSPQLVERALADEIPFAGQICCLGDGRPYLIAIVTVSGRAEGLASEAQAGVERASQRLGRAERPRRLLLVEGEWSPESGLITPTHKVRRGEIERHYAAELEALYAAPGSDPAEVLVHRCRR